MADLVVEKHCVYLDEKGKTTHIETDNDDTVAGFPFLGILRGNGDRVCMKFYNKEGEASFRKRDSLVKKLDCPPIDFSVFGQMNKDGAMAVFQLESDVLPDEIASVGWCEGIQYGFTREWNPITEKKGEYVLRPAFGEEYTNSIIDELITLLESKREK